MFQPIDDKKKIADLEKEVLSFWNKNKIFEKSLENRKDAKKYIFKDGPPFATGTPHYGHLVASVMKDVVPRYWTMRGFFVERKWGWDCHGLPIENIAEKELGISHKKEIEEMGIEKFNETCRSKVLGYVKEWEIIINRLGRWVDMKNCYKTMDLSFMESVWWVFKELWKKGLIYEGYRSMHICPRCETTLSQSEVSEGYKDVKDLSVIAKFELEDEPGTFVLAWTTTPWTLIGNVALAVGDKIKYCKIKFQKPARIATQSVAGGLDLKNTNQNSNMKYGEFYILAEDRLSKVLQDEEYEIVEKFEGKDLVGKKYKPLFDYYSKQENLKGEAASAEAVANQTGWKIYEANFVTTEEGTGVVHIAPAFGEDDLNLGKEKNLPFVQHVGIDGIIRKEAGEFAGLLVKPKDDHQKTDVEIIKYLADKNLLFDKEQYKHSYPHCWRCETPLINYATSSWFVNVGKIKDDAIELAKEINWIPKHIKEGRFGKWLEGARDWSISRQRYWASVMPIWKCDQKIKNQTSSLKKNENKNVHVCENIKVIGSVDELEKLSGEKITDLHKHVVDKITFKCEKCGGTMRRIPDVLDTWFDSGSMPYAEDHNPAPAKFIAEGVDQTRCWFYYLHLISSAIKKSVAYENVVVNGIVLAEDGKKMSKRLRNYPDPAKVLEEYGADALRFYILSSPVMSAENLNFKESDIADVVRGMRRMLWNSYSFFVLYAEIDKFEPKENTLSKNLLDKWIISELNMLIKEVNRRMEDYELNKAVKSFPAFIDNLSNWYIRRSRRRFWKSENDEDKNSAYQTLYTVLLELSKVMSPFTPFISEMIYGNLKIGSTKLTREGKSVPRNSSAERSVHLENFPIADENIIDEKLNDQMAKTRKIVELGLAARAKAGIKVRQPLSGIIVMGSGELLEELQSLIIDEINVKKLQITNNKLQRTNEKTVAVENNGLTVLLNTEISDDLRIEGIAREIVRFIQQARKEAGFNVDDRINVLWSSNDENIKKAFSNFAEYIKREVLAEKVGKNVKDNFIFEKEAKNWSLKISKA